MNINFSHPEYPFTSRFFHLGQGLNLHYLDEGQGEALLMLHGNPTWSFYYRNLVKEFSSKFRVIVPDHIGCGLSSKPQNYDYTLENHISNVEKLLTHLKVEKLNLVVHDWGGAIGFGLLERNPELAKKIVILNTAAYTSNFIPWRINILRSCFGEFFVRSLNAFAWPATFMASAKGLSADLKAAYLFPYDNYAHRIATARFVRDIPMDESHGTYKTLQKIEKSLSRHDCPKLVLWGKKDFCFNDYFLKRWKEIYPGAQYREYDFAGHYVLEDAREEVLSELRSFL